MERISVIGFGKIGQAVAANILRNKIAVTAIDRNPDIGKSVADGSYATNEPGLRQIILQSHQRNLLQISSDFAAIRQSNAVIIAIPLLIDEQKNILHEPFAECMRSIAPHLSDKMLVVIETSMPVGYGRNYVVKAIEDTGKKHGRDFLLAYSPERIKSGTMLSQLQLIPKVIGAVTEEAADKAVEVYAHFFGKDLLYKVESIEAAEMVKLGGMIYRDVNIALANQLAQFANAINVNFADLIPLINTDREANLLQPGIGVGGHCTPVYPYFLMENFRSAGLNFTLAKEGRLINNQMAAHALSLVRDKVNKKTALILGLSFRPNVKEDTLSTTYVLQEELLKEGFSVVVNDTEFSASELEARGFTATDSIYDGGAELVFLVTMHVEYESLDFKRLAASGVRFFVDGRNTINRKKVTDAGIEYFGIGR